jgi:uncharacterized protein HemX
MTQQNERPTVVIDMKSDDQPPQKPASRLPAVLALLALLVTLVVVGLAYYYWQNLQQDLARMTASAQATAQVQQKLQQSITQAQEALEAQQQLLEKRAETLTDYKQAFRKQSDLLTAERNRMQQREVELRAIIADLRKRLGNPDARWLVAEAEYLIQLAMQRLRLVDDVGTALVALQQADQRLGETGEARWMVVRYQLDQDMVALKQLQLPDIGALLEQMDALASRFSSLRPRLVAREGDEKQPPATTPSTENAASPGLHGLGQALWSGLKDSVHVRRHDQPVANLLTSGQEAILVQNATLLLETARLALVQKDSALYRDSLQRLADWLTRYFRLDDALGQQVVKEIQSLQAANLKPEFPDLSLALEALQTRKSLDQGKVAK